MAEATLTDEDLARLRGALEKIQARWRRTSESWHAERRYPTEYSKAWHDGFVSALAEDAMIAGAALDPDAHRAAEELWHLGNTGTDRMWFEKTGCCGHCGNPGAECGCTSEDPCGCGPHERAS